MQMVSSLPSAPWEKRQAELHQDMIAGWLKGLLTSSRTLHKPRLLRHADGLASHAEIQPVRLGVWGMQKTSNLPNWPDADASRYLGHSLVSGSASNVQILKAR